METEKIEKSVRNSVSFFVCLLVCLFGLRWLELIWMEFPFGTSKLASVVGRRSKREMESKRIIQLGLGDNYYYSCFVFLFVGPRRRRFAGNFGWITRTVHTSPKAHISFLVGRCWPPLLLLLPLAHCAALSASSCVWWRALANGKLRGEADDGPTQHTAAAAH